ncbi:hypothetical protein KVR01_009803 [Diaporthe batatas]|uniref:uncharacterized protein n=1 Tax=Diaporthe batatas TaxID=748121 RepID=UPI001D03EF6C|nr:uncharacterized protein KVR01_009803 [Diaporthe batatas]KAG8160267.1 hypothetical protein KVR01_009803 [Diaporthe batatas]
MPPVPFHQLSDEPLYCEAVHDKDEDGFYSGSEDDHYEGPLHRRLHIEKKAIDFLSGNVPILISAALRGPFDRKHWNNPWRSTRADPCKDQPTHPRQTAVSEEDLPDTQGTSLYPLPSPETTNPPSAKKNPYMDEQDYSRVKNWRAAVKSTSASKDPFWQSHEDDKDEKFTARKRSADSTWLHKRDRKKPRSANNRTSSPDDFPSRGVSRPKGLQTRQRHASQMVAQFLRNSSPPDDELAADDHTRPSSSNTPPMAKKPMAMTPHGAKWLFYAYDNSDDELSLPATTPTSTARYTSAMVSASRMRNRSPTRRIKATMSKSRPMKKRSTSSSARAKPRKLQAAQSSPSRGSDHDGSGAGSHVAAFDSMDVSPRNWATKQSESPLDQPLPNTSTVESMFLPQNLAAQSSAQQDSSFLFHKRARIPTGANEHGISISVSKGKAALNQSALQLNSTKMDEQQDQSAPGDDQAAPIGFGPTIVTGKNSQVNQIFSTELSRMCRDPALSPAVDQGSASSQNQPDQQNQPTDEHKVNDEAKMAVESIAKVEPDAGTDSAKVVQLAIASEPWGLEQPRSFPQGDGCSQSDSEWSTYLDTEDRIPVSASEQDTMKKSDSMLIVEYGVDGSSDPEWSTSVNTQDITAVIANLEAAVGPEEAAHQQIGSDRSALTNAKCLPPVTLDAAGTPYQKVKSTPVGMCSTGLVGHTNEPPEDSATRSFPEDQMHTQASVGSIIDAYAEFGVLSHSSEPTTTENPAEQLETEAEVSAFPCPLSNQITTVSADGFEVHNEILASEEPQQLQAALEKSDDAKCSLGLICGPTKSDENPIFEDTRYVENLSVPILQTLSAAKEPASRSDGSSSLDEPTIAPEELQIQDPWGQVATSPLRVAPPAPSNETRPGFHSDGLGEAAADIQSPWNDKADLASPLFVPLTTLTNTAGSTPDLSILAGKALAISQQPQSPWEPKTPAAPNPPAQDFGMSIRAFSDFMSPSPVKKRAAFNTKFSGPSSVKPGILFKTPGQPKADRRVHFAPLPGEQEMCFTDFELDESIAIYDEQEVSYFDPSGNKTGTMRMPKLTTRATSPPPMEMISVEAGGLPDYDQKFAKHFEAMSKRKNPSRRSLRLLPLESQPTVTASPEVGAMAEAFIQASQTRKRGLELAAEKGNKAECRPEFVGKNPVPAAMVMLEDQENVEPVDDVSLVLDNLDKFLDNTWGIDMGTGENPADDACSKQEKETALNQGAARKVEDPMFDLEANVWAD